MTHFAADRGADSRRHGRAKLVITETTRRAGFTFRGQFGRGGVPETTPEWSTEAPTEYELGRLLTSLDDRFRVLRAFDVFGDLDADFVVVGPAGLFLITSRVQRNASIWVDEDMLWVNGRPTNRVRDARTSAERASARFSVVLGQPVRATPVISIMNPVSLAFGGEPAQRIVTLPADLVSQWLSDCSRTLSDDAVADFARVAEDRATWGSPPSGSSRLARVR